MKNKFLIWLILGIGWQLDAQTYLMNGTPIAGCTGTFYDSGGSNGNYANNQNMNSPICPDGSGNTHVQLTFNALNIAPGDQLCVYDGPNVLAPLLACFSDAPVTLPLTTTATAANPTGCLTVSFVSDGTTTALGWQADLGCYNPCPLPAPQNPHVVFMKNGNMVWVWDAVPNAVGYEVRINNGTWQTASGNLSHTVSGLAPGNLIVIEIRAVSNIPGCGANTITANKTYVECTLQGGLDTVEPADCPGSATGSAGIISLGGVPPIQYFLDNNPNPSPGSDFSNILAAGNHQVILLDAAGCYDTVKFNITEPPPLMIGVTVLDDSCHGDNSGAIWAVASGGTPPYSYAWQGCQGGTVVADSAAFNLFAGCYAVTVTDEQGCTGMAQDSVQEPEQFMFTSTQDSVGCFGGMDGKAAVFITGGHSPYRYKWDNGDTTQTASNLKAAFHSVTITDAWNCQAVTLVQVLQATKLVIDSIPVMPVSCFGGNNGSATVFVKGGVKPYSYQWSNMKTTPAISGLSAGVYTVTVSDFHGCTTVFSATIDAPPALTPVINNISPESCASACDGKMTLNIAGGKPPYGITWSNALIPPGTLMPQNLCAGTYTVTVSDNNGCTKTSTATIAPAAAILVQLTIVAPKCAGDLNGSINTAISGGTPGYQYQWNTGQATPGIQNLGCGAYTVTVTDAKGCKIIKSDSLPCPAPLVLDSIRAHPVRCFGEANGSISVWVHGGTGMPAYAWSDPNQQNSDVAVNLSKNTYTVTVSDATGCSLTASAAVTEPPPLTVSVQVTPVACFGGKTGAIRAIVTGGVPGYTYSWNVQQDSSTITGLPAGTYSLTVIDSYGCPMTVAPIQVPQPASAISITATQTRKACFGTDDGEAFATASGGAGMPYQFTWSNGLTGPNPDHFNVGIYTVTAVDAAGCTGTQTLSIEEWSKIEIGILQIPPTCSGGNDGQAGINLINGGAGGGAFSNYHYHWSVPGTTDTLYINGLSGGQVYSVTVSDKEGCSVSEEFTLSDQQPIVPQFAVDSVSCFGLSDGAITISSIQSKRPIVNYLWSRGDMTKDIAALPAGTYTVTLTDNKGCTGTASVTVLEPPVLQLQLDIKALICNIDSNAVISAVVQGGSPEYRYAWSTGSTDFRITGLGPGDYTVTVTDRNGCTVATSTFISQPNPPAIQSEVTLPDCFGGRNGYFKLLVSGGAAPYRYSLDGQSYNGAAVFLGLGAGTYTAYVKDADGCVTAANIEIGQPLPVLVNLDPDTKITLGDSLLINSDVFNAVGLSTYAWDGFLKDSIRCADAPDCTQVWVFPQYDNTYQLTVTDANGCTGKAAIRVGVEKPRGVFIPTGFSPNDDGNNDLLFVRGKGAQILRIKMFRIYDRWGELVYEDADFKANDDQRGWNGRFRNEDCPPGVYVWHVELEYLDGFEQVLNGHTTLIR